GGVHGHGPREVVLRHPVGGEDVDVGVGDVETGDDVACAGGTEGLPDRDADLLRHLIEAGPQGGGEIGPAVDLLHGDDQHVAVPQRLDGEEGDDLVIAVDETARQLAVDDLGEHATHGAQATRRRNMWV